MIHGTNSLRICIICGKLSSHIMCVYFVLILSLSLCTDVFAFTYFSRTFGAFTYTHTHLNNAAPVLYVPIFKRLLAALRTQAHCMYAPSTWHFRIIDRFIHRQHWKSLNFYFFGKHIRTLRIHTPWCSCSSWNSLGTSNEHDNLQTEPNW